MERHTRGGWKVGLKPGLVAALLGMLVAVLLSGLLTRGAPSHRTGHRASLTPGPTAAMEVSAPGLTVPASWKQVLPGLILSDFSHYNTLVTSAQQPDRVAACGMPSHPWPQMVAPTFVLSVDGGRTWEQQAIPVVGMVWSCDLRGDIADPDTYALSVTHIVQGKAVGPDQTVVTHDGGRTWRLESPPARMDYSCVPLLQRLGMPQWVDVDACAVDPSDPVHLYAITATPTKEAASTPGHGLSLYETRDDWRSWSLLHTWSTAERLMEFHFTTSALYVVDNQDLGGEQGVYRSSDGGATWVRLVLKSPVSTVNYFGPTGRLLATAYPQLFQIDPATGTPTLLGEVPVINESNGEVGGVISAVAVCEGNQPSLVVSGPYGNYVRMLPPEGA